MSYTNTNIINYKEKNLEPNTIKTYNVNNFVTNNNIIIDDKTNENVKYKVSKTKNNINTKKESLSKIKASSKTNISEDKINTNNYLNKTDNFYVDKKNKLLLQAKIKRSELLKIVNNEINYKIKNCNVKINSKTIKETISKYDQDLKVEKSYFFNETINSNNSNFLLKDVSNDINKNNLKQAIIYINSNKKKTTKNADNKSFLLDSGKKTKTTINKDINNISNKKTNNKKCSKTDNFIINYKNNDKTVNTNSPINKKNFTFDYNLQTNNYNKNNSNSINCNINENKCSPKKLDLNNCNKQVTFNSMFKRSNRRKKTVIEKISHNKINIAQRKLYYSKILLLNQHKKKLSNNDVLLINRKINNNIEKETKGNATCNLVNFNNKHTDNNCDLNTLDIDIASNSKSKRSRKFQSNVEVTDFNCIYSSKYLLENENISSNLYYKLLNQNKIDLRNKILSHIKQNDNESKIKDINNKMNYLKNLADERRRLLKINNNLDIDTKLNNNKDNLECKKKIEQNACNKLSNKFINFSIFKELDNKLNIDNLIKQENKRKSFNVCLNNASSLLSLNSLENCLSKLPSKITSSSTNTELKDSNNNSSKIKITNNKLKVMNKESLFNNIKNTSDSSHNFDFNSKNISLTSQFLISKNTKKEDKLNYNKNSQNKDKPKFNITKTLDEIYTSINSLELNQLSIKNKKETYNYTININNSPIKKVKNSSLNRLKNIIVENNNLKNIDSSSLFSLSKSDKYAKRKSCFVKSDSNKLN